MSEATLIDRYDDCTIVDELCKKTTDPYALLIQDWVSVLGLVLLSPLVLEMKSVLENSTQNCDRRNNIRCQLTQQVCSQAITAIDLDAMLLEVLLDLR